MKHIKHFFVSLGLAIAIVFEKAFKLVARLAIIGFGITAVVFLFISFIDGFPTGWDILHFPLLVCLSATVGSVIISFICGEIKTRYYNENEKSHI